MPNRGNERNAVCKHESWPRFNFYLYARPFSHMLHLFIGLPARTTPNLELPSIYIKKRRNGGWNSQKALHVSSLFKRGRFLGRGWVILGCLANRLWSPFGKKTKLLCGVKTSPDRSVDLCVLRKGYHKLFCVFGDFYASGMHNAEVTKSLHFH